MRKIYLSMLLLMLCVVCAVANPVTQAQALQKAKAFLQKRGMTTATNLNLVYQGRQVAQKHGAPAKDPCYYVFNNGQNAGFVIMAGDDCADEVLGYADNGKFDPNDIPDNMEAFLKGYVEEIEAARARHSSPNNTDVAVEVTRKVVAPLIQTHWNQEDPYNQMCFTTSGAQAVTGCVATALAQVMYYHKWPQAATDTIPSYSNKKYPTLPSTTFKWNKMKPVYINTGEDDEEAENAVAELMLYCGHAVKMRYGTGASSASPYDIPGALKKCFGYPNDPQYVYRSSYTTEEWDELIYNELKCGRPVLYGANTSAAGSGHEFICDGYDGHGLYHINWGWGGQSDGYFRLQALRPADQGTGGSSGYGGYSLEHDAVIGVSATEIVNTEEPEEPIVINSGLETQELKVTSDLAIDYAPTTGFNSVQVTFTFALAKEDRCVDFGFAVCQDGQILQQNSIKQGTTLETTYAYSTSGGLFRGLGYDLTDGTYQIVGISRVNGTEEWYINERSDKRYVEVVISNGHATFTNVEINPPAIVHSINVTKIEQRFDLGDDFTQIRTYFANTGNADFSSYVSLRIDDQTMAKEGIYIPIGGEDYIDFFFEPMSGTVKLQLTTYYTNNLYTNEEFILSDYTAPELPELQDLDVSFKNIESGFYGGKMYGSMLDGAVTLKNNSSFDFAGDLTLRVNVFLKEDEQGMWSNPREVSIPINIKANETKIIPVTYTGLTVGDQFRYTLYAPDGTTLDASVWLDVVPAIATWKATGERTAVAPATNYTVPGDVCAVSLEDLGNSLGNYQITLNDNPNTLYYTTGSATGFNPNGAIIVKGGIAGEVELDANKDFFVPMNFRASNVVYRWTPELGADGKNGWQTITLPFGVQSVTSEANSIDWYHGNETNDDKDFWVREFKQVEGNTVKFADALEWVANVPYIIAVPGDHWGAQYDLTKKEMRFIAENALVERTAISAVVSDGFEFVGLTGELDSTSGLDNVYVLNANGSAFVPIESTLITGKHNLAYFTINDRTITPPACLNIGTFDTADGISTPRIAAAEGQQVDVYAIDGVKVSSVTINNGTIDLSNLPKGVYIVDGKKIVNQ